ncbi:MAG: hypothetical protein LLG97_19350 [Deltaproteobacteria bacterium]|nr:hypothetical protein [Deltaproteobacteria bacterium]
MANWPTLPSPDTGTKEAVYKPQLKLEFEANYIQSAPRATRHRRRFPLTWELMTEAEYQILEAFFLANQGGSFTYTHPIRSTSHTCVFSADSIEHKWRSGGWVGGVSCPIEEI